MDSRRDFTSKKVFPGYFSELSEKANPSLHKRSSAGFPSPARRLSPLRPLGAHRAQSEPLPRNKRYRAEVTREVGG